MNPAGKLFAGRTVAIVHPAWHSCGTYQVVLGQVEAWAALGARVVTIAVSDEPGYKPQRGWLWDRYRRATPELDAHPRFIAGAPAHVLIEPRFVREALWPYVHGDQAAIRVGLTTRASMSLDPAREQIDLIHCNHFFCMPVALRLASLGQRILLDTHDVQARQYEIITKDGPWLRPRASYEQMLKQELEWMARADALLHLNSDEDEIFRRLLPDKQHALLYPAVPDVPTGPGGDEIVLVSSRNSANVESALWFLREVAPRIPGIAVRIYGSVDAGVRAADAALYERHRNAFAGRVDRIEAVYERARLALLPTVSGTGLSIKSVEAMASGLPLVATSHAFRGMRLDLATLANVRVADDAESFAAALRAAAAGPAPSPTDRRSSPTRLAYEAHFSSAAYAANLAAVAGPLMA